MEDKSEAQIGQLGQALMRLEESLAKEPTEIVKDAAIQRFEFCFELSWKLMQSLARLNRLEAGGAKSSIRLAARLGIIEDPDMWFNFLTARNYSTHIYNEAMASVVYEKAKEFLPEARKMLEKARQAI